MTNKEIVERAKAAEKRTVFGALVHNPISRGVNSPYGIGFIEGMEEYRNFLSEPASEGLEEAACNYGDELDNVLSVGVDDDSSIGDYAQEAFKAGAKWQKEQFEKDYTNLCNGIATVKGLAVSMAYEKGVADTKQQMMKDAIDTEVKVDAGGYPYVDRTIELYDYDRDIPLAKLGDKVKIIVIKDE